MMNIGVDVGRGGLSACCYYYRSMHMGRIWQRIIRNVAGSALHGIGEQPVGGTPRANGGRSFRAEAILERPEQRHLNEVVTRIAHTVGHIAPPEFSTSGSSRSSALRPRTTTTSIVMNLRPCS